MSSRPFISFACITTIALLSLSGSAESRHIHHHHQEHYLSRKHVHHRHHHHVARQVQSPSLIFAPLPTVATTAAALPSITAADALQDDLAQIQDGMNDFSTDLSAFFEAIQQWLRAFSGMLAEASSLSPPKAEPGPEIFPSPMPSATAAASSVTYHEPVPVPVPVLTIAPDGAASASTTIAAAALGGAGAEAASSLCRPPAGAGPLVPCPPAEETTTTTGFETVRSTSTRRNTVTMYQSGGAADGGTTVAAAEGSGVVSSSLATGGVPYPVVNNVTASLSMPTTPPTILSVAYVYSSTTSAAATEGSTMTASTAAAYGAPPPMATPYTFNATARDNVAVYYGSSPNTQPNGLETLCANPNVDIILLAFISSFPSPSTDNTPSYPTLSFGPACLASTPAQLAAPAPGLEDCTPLAPQITTCQLTHGKKILVSLGGWGANSTFASEADAITFADQLWDLFGAPTDPDPDTAALRPFGPDVVVDGFDIDNEDHSTAYWPEFTRALRARFAGDPSKRYYISAAPQCPIPDESIPLSVMTMADFVWVQFYNNPRCDLDSAAFQSSFAAWAGLLGRESEAGGAPPMLFLGVPAFAGAGSGYVAGAALYSRVTQARELHVGNFGGVMLWEGTEAAGNVDGYGVDYLSYAKEALHL